NGPLRKAVAFKPSGPGVFLEHDLFAAIVGRQARIQPDPCLNGDVGGLERERIRNLRVAVGAVETKSLSNHAGGITGPAGRQRAVVRADSVAGVALPFPPTHQSRRRRIASAS